MKIARFIFNPFSENTYILCDDEQKEAAIVDPGMESEADVTRVADFLKENGLSLKMVLLTHQHVDHVLRSLGMKPMLCGAKNSECRQECSIWLVK